MANGLTADLLGGISKGLGVRGELQRQKLLQEQADAAKARQAQLKGLLGQIGSGQQMTQMPSQAPGLGATPGIAPPEVADQFLQRPQDFSRQALAQLAVQFPEQFEMVNKNLGLVSQQQKNEAADFAFQLRNTPFDQRAGLIQQRAGQLQAQGRNAADTLQLLDMPEADQNEALDTVQVAALSPTQRIELAEGRAERAQKVAGELDEISEVQRSNILPGGLVQIVRKDGSIETIPANEADEALIKAAEQRGAELQGLRAGERGAAAAAIEEGQKAFEQTAKIRQNVRNLNRGIDLIDSGAKTGRVERLLPSIRKASVELDQLQKELGLDVIGSVTFGALSEGELNLALDTALPTGLDEVALRDWLVRKRDAQNKLLNEVEEAAIFLSDPANNISDFIASKKDVEQASPNQIGRFTVEVE